MIKYSEINNLVSQLSFECREYNLEKDSEINIPYAAYNKISHLPIFADGFNLINFIGVNLFLVFSNESEYADEIRKLFNDNNISFTEDYDFDEDERIHMITFTFVAIND